MYQYIIDELMHRSPIINNASPLMPALKRCSSNIKQIFLGGWGAVFELKRKLETRSKRGKTGRGEKTMRAEFISQTVTYGFFMKG